MKKMIFLSLALLSATHFASKAAEDMSAEALFPNVSRQMKIIKSSIMQMLKNGDLEQACLSLVNADKGMLAYIFNENPYINNKTAHGKNLLHVACEYGNSLLALMLYQMNPAMLRQYDEQGHTPLYYACKYGHNLIVDTINPTSLEEFVSQDQQAALYTIPGNYWEQRRLQDEFDAMR